MAFPSRPCSSPLTVRFLCLLVVFFLFHEAKACTRLSVYSETLGKMDFLLEEGVLHSNRPVFRQVIDDPRGSPNWLYHTMVEPQEEGVGRWFIGHDMGSSAGVAFVDSWAAVPQAISEMSPLGKWHVQYERAWKLENEVNVKCMNEFDPTLYICSDLNKGVCGFYFPYVVEEGTLVLHSTNHRKLYWIPEAKRWMVSEDEVGSHSGVAFVSCQDSSSPSTRDILYLCSREWEVATDEGWQKDPNFIFLSGGSTAAGIPSVFSRLRALTNAAANFSPQQAGPLSNGLSLPMIALGTGGLSREETKEITKLAITEFNYRLIDTASEYNNEDVIGETLREIDPTGALRSQVMVLSKVWPTRLGFQPTLETIDEGLNKLRSGYFDVYLLHWPFCDKNIEWMNCPPNPSGTWQQSWRALERAYGEGTVRAIGVSNFDGSLLKELFDFASVPPHLVQNWMDPLHVNNDVLSLCADHNTMFQAYSLIREWAGRTSGNRKTKQTIRKIASRNRMTISELLLRWAIQLGEQMNVNFGATIRSKTRVHLGSNLAVVKNKQSLSPETMQLLTELQYSLFPNEL